MIEIPQLIIYFILFMSLYFEIFLLLVIFEDSFLNKKTESKKEGGKCYEPTVSIIIPCYNEEKTLGATVESLLRLEYPKNKLKIYIVNDGSKDNTKEIAMGYSKNSNIEILNKENGGKHTAINLALKRINSEIVGCLDADSFVEPNSLKKLLEKLEDTNTKAVTPAIKINKPKTIIQLIQKSEYMFSIFIRKTFHLTNSQFVTPGPFSMFKREIFEEIGLFKSAHNTEDMEMCLRIQSFKYKVKNSSKAIVYTNAPKNIRSLFRQRVRWTYGFIKNAIDYKFMFFRPSYGTLGMLILPMVMFSIFSTLFFVGYILFGGLKQIIAFSEKIASIGISFPKIKLDLFFLNTDLMTFLIYTIILITIIIIMTGKYLSDEKKKWTPDIFFYIFLYGIIAPTWLGKSVYNVIFSKKESWSGEHDKR